MPQFSVQVGRDARVYYTATVEAESLDDAQSKLSRHGYDSDPDVSWTLDGTDDFDNVETCAISTADGETLLASYSDGDGWETPQDRGLIGQKMLFTYPRSFSEVEGHRAHSGQIVEVIGKGEDFDVHEADGDPIWRIRATDGWTGDAWQSELSPC